ncbi:c-type cytochrome [Chitinophaga caeni]|uniref:c-type cytochrome n=1 Tax=Chitinophaga caeni TaxID=2029983 RepID=UPI003743D47F
MSSKEIPIYCCHKAENFIPGPFSNCGERGTAGIGHAANLHTGRLECLTIINTINNGKNGMPSYSSQLAAAEISELTAYLLSLRGK